MELYTPLPENISVVRMKLEETKFHAGRPSHVSTSCLMCTHNFYLFLHAIALSLLLSFVIVGRLEGERVLRIPLKMVTGNVSHSRMIHCAFLIYHFISILPAYYKISELILLIRILINNLIIFLSLKKKRIHDILDS